MRPSPRKPASGSTEGTKFVYRSDRRSMDGRVGKRRAGAVLQRAQRHHPAALQSSITIVRKGNYDETILALPGMTLSLCLLALAQDQPAENGWWCLRAILPTRVWSMRT